MRISDPKIFRRAKEYLEIAFCLYGDTPFLTQRYFRLEVWGLTPGVHQCKAKGYKAYARCRSPWLYIPSRPWLSQPCLPYVGICIGLMLADDLVVCGARPSLCVLPRIIQLPRAHGC